MSTSRLRDRDIFLLPSWPDSVRPYTPSVRLGFKDVDARDKRGYDESILIELNEIRAT